jgi:hypothetical protein
MVIYIAFYSAFFRRILTMPIGTGELRKYERIFHANDTQWVLSTLSAEEAINKLLFEMKQDATPAYHDGQGFHLSRPYKLPVRWNIKDQ